MPVVPPNLLGAIANNSTNSANESDAARRTLNIDDERATKRARMSSPLPKPPSNPSLLKLVNFYDPSTKRYDAAGRTLEQILAWSDGRLERQHDFIQGLFPLPEGSVFNYNAPVIDEEAFLYIRQHAGLQSNLRRALSRMLAFYGFEITWEQSNSGEELEPHVKPKEDRRKNFARWVRPVDHNHLRITRIIRSLRVLGLGGEARAFFDALVSTYEEYGRISASTVDYWRRAVDRPLHTAPDGTKVEWLEKYDAADQSEEDDRERSSGVIEGAEEVKSAEELSPPKDTDEQEAKEVKEDEIREEKAAADPAPGPQRDSPL